MTNFANQNIKNDQMKRFVFALLWLCSCVAISNAANVYVTTTGVDAQDGLSWATAKSSI